MLECGSGDPGSIPGKPLPHVGPLMARRLKTFSGVPVPVLGVDLAHTYKRPLTVVAHCVGCPAADLNLETGQLSYHYIV